MEPKAQTGDSSVRSRVEVLDLLRLLAVLAVVLFHYGFRGGAADEGATERAAAIAAGERDRDQQGRQSQ